MAHTPDGPGSGTVFNIQRFSLHDGPGIRTVVFLKGCPMRCSWCHNPEGIAPFPELGVAANRCIACGACAEACPRGLAGAGEAPDRDRCERCGRCAEACPTGARTLIGRTLGVGEVVEEALRDRVFYLASGGGVTFSGGEPLAQPGFVAACLEACRREGLHTALDTCGLAPRGALLAAARTADLILFDLKHTQAERHLALTGAPLAPVLANLRAVAAAHDAVWLRVPVVPGLNDDEENLAAVARIAADLPSVRKVSLLPYHRTGDAKHGRLGRTPSLDGVAPPSPERMRALAARVAAAGVAVAVGG